MLVPDALQGVMTDTQIELPNETACAEGGQGFAELHELRFAGEGSFVRLAVASPRMFVKTGRSVLLKAAQPLAHGGDRRSEERRVGKGCGLGWLEGRGIGDVMMV